MEETIKLKCEKCGVDYEKPAVYKEYVAGMKRSLFYRWSLAFCDKCRLEKEREALKALPNVLGALEEKLKTTTENVDMKH